VARAVMLFLSFLYCNRLRSSGISRITITGRYYDRNSWFVLLLIIALAVLIIVAGIVIYISCPSENNGQVIWSDIDVQLKSGMIWVPNLVETVKGYASHENPYLRT